MNRTILNETTTPNWAIGKSFETLYQNEKDEETIYKWHILKDRGSFKITTLVSNGSLFLETIIEELDEAETRLYQSAWMSSYLINGNLKDNTKRNPGINNIEEVLDKHNGMCYPYCAPIYLGRILKGNLIRIK